MSGIEPTDAELWTAVVAAHHAFSIALRDLTSKSRDRSEIVRHALLGPERATALYVLEKMSVDEIRDCAKELVFLSSFSHGAVEFVRTILLRLPREYLIGVIPSIAEPILSSGTYDEYRRILELYERIDGALTERLARRAAANADPDIREAGIDFLNRLGKSANE